MSGWRASVRPPWGSYRTVCGGSRGPVPALLLAYVLLFAGPSTVRAIPVFDASSFAQELATAIEAVKQTAGQLEAYKLQLTQYQQMVRDGAADIVYTWDSLEEIHERVAHLDDEVTAFTAELAEWGQQIRSREYYRNSPCYGSDLSCYQAEWDKVIESYRNWEIESSESQRRTLQLLVEVLGVEREKLKATKENTKKIRRQAETADGRWKAQQAGNMLAAQVATHLEAIREIIRQFLQLLVVQHAIAMDRESRQAAAKARFLRPMATKTPERRLQVWPR